MEIKKQDVVRIERLARLKLPEDQVQGFSERLTKVFDWIDQLKEVSVEGVVPMASPLTSFSSAKTAWRQDAVSDGDIQEKILANAPESSHGFFVVPKVVE